MKDGVVAGLCVKVRRQLGGRNTVELRDEAFDLGARRVGFVAPT